MSERHGIGPIWRSVAIAIVLWSTGVSVAFSQTPDDLFDDSALQEIRLVVSTRDWQALKDHFDDNIYYPADLTWHGLTVRNIGIRSRGGATRNPLKPGLRVDINHYVTDQQFLGLKAFALDNMYSDTSLVRETVTMKMFAKMNLPASRESHVRLYVNNQYVGAYVIIEAVDRTFIDRTFGSQEANVERGGYLFEYQWISPYQFEYPGPSLEAYAARFKPQTRDTDSIVNIYGPLEEMIRTINESADGDFAPAVGQYLDLRLFMKYLAVESFMVEWDGLTGFAGANNFYLYRFRNGVSQFIPKDKDASLAYLDVPVSLRFDANVLVRRAVADPALREAFLSELRECMVLAAEPAADDPRGWLEREVDRETALVSTAIADDPVFPYSFDDFRAAAATLLRFAQIRPSYVGCQIAEMEDGLQESEDLSAACSDVLDNSIPPTAFALAIPYR